MATSVATPLVAVNLGAGSMAPGAEFSCSTCGDFFDSGAELRTHCKTERHVYNTKRRMAGLKPITQEAWERKLKESREAAVLNKGTAHLKEGKQQKTRSSNRDSEASEVADAARPATEEEIAADDAAADAEYAALAQPPVAFSATRCLFDTRNFSTLEDNLAYMRKQYDFEIPDREYCTDVNKLLEFLWNKIHFLPHGCLNCNRRFPDAKSCLRHMRDTRHARIGTDAKTRRGRPDESGSEDMKADLEEFYNFTGSSREITDKITRKDEKVACLVRFFDEDRDGHLNHQELADMWAAALEHAAEQLQKVSGEDDQEPQNLPELSEAMYAAACRKVGADPDEGLDARALQRVYAEGLANLDDHFRMLQDRLSQKLKSRRLRKVVETGENADGEQNGAIAEEEGSEEEDDAESGEESDADSDGTEVIECNDEAEFEEVMRVLGLQKMTVTDNGDLQLPNGKVACHRDVAYIWKQRITSYNGAVVVKSGGHHRARKSQLMISNAPAGTQVAVSHRMLAKDGKRIVAFLGRQAMWKMKMGMKNNGMQRKCLKIRTSFGDASGGR